MSSRLPPVSEGPTVPEEPNLPDATPRSGASSLAPRPATARPPASAATRFFRRWAERVLALRAPLVALNLALTVLTAWAMVSLMETDVSGDPFLPRESRARDINDSVQQDFGKDLFFTVLVEGDVFSQDFLERLRALHQALAAIDVEIPSMVRPGDAKAKAASPSKPAGTQAADAEDEGWDGDEGWDDGEGWGDETGGSIFEEVSSLINARDTRWVDDGLRIEGLLERWPSAAQIPLLRKRVLENASVVGRFVGARGQHAVLQLRTGFMNDGDTPLVQHAIEQVIASHQAPGFLVRIGGIGAMIAQLTEGTEADTQDLFVFSAILMVVLLGLIFRHPVGVIGPLLSVGQSTVWVLGASAMLGKPMTQVTAIIPAFIICVGVGDAVHIQSAYRDALRHGADSREAIARALESTGLPVLYTTLTTAVGLLSFQFADASATQDMGLLGAIGVVFAMLHCLTTVPICLSFHRKGLFGARPGSERRPPSDWIERALRRCERASAETSGGSQQRRWWVLATAALASALALFGVSRLYVSHDDLRYLDEQAQVRQVLEALDEHVGGTSDFLLLIEPEAGAANNLASRDILLGLEQLEKHILAYRDPQTGEAPVSGITGLLDVARETHRALNGDRPEAYAIPDSQRGVADVFTLFQNSGPEHLRLLATIDLRRSLMRVAVRWMDARRHEPLAAHIRTGIAQHMKGLARVTLTGSAPLFIEVTNLSLRDLVRSFGVALLVVSVLMVWLLRDLKLGLISMLPNLAPILWVLGFMGAVGIWLDYTTVLIASIALGIVVDDTIHFLHQYRVHRDATGDREAAIRFALAHSGRPMVITSVILVAGFLVFSFAQMGSSRLFGHLTSLTVLFALVADLLVAPALLRALQPRRRPAAPSADSAPEAR